MPIISNIRIQKFHFDAKKGLMLAYDNRGVPQYPTRH